MVLTYAAWEQMIAISDTVEDEVWIVKNYHGPYEGHPDHCGCTAAKILQY